MSFGGPVLAPEAQPGLAAIESAGETSLFDFGLTDDLGLSDRSMVRVARADSDASADAGDALHAGLIVERGGRVERVMAWEAPELVVGRAPDCGLVLGGSGVSRRHAELRVDEDVHDIRDLGSANGVYVNGTRVERVALEQGDVIRIDDYTLTFVLDREPVAESVQGSVGSAQGSVGSLQASAAREAERVEASQEPIPERDLVLAEDAELEPVAAEKQLEASASDATSASDTGDPLVWAFEVAIATERLPEGLRRALEEMDAAELVLPAQLRLVRRN
jgi:pSer/pThr/pTyr-binding forkhead associated (FHA) protein